MSLDKDDKLPAKRARAKKPEFVTSQKVKEAFAARYEGLGDVRELMEVAGFTDSQIKYTLRDKKFNGLGAIISTRGYKNVVDPGKLFAVLEGLDVRVESGQP